jgi:PBP1b-binding outer membrane lipoprotein LpoB
MLNVRRLFLVAALALLFTGCESLSPIKAFKDKDKQDSLTKTLHSYELTVRWGDMVQMYTFLEPDLASKTIQQENLNNIRVTSYDVMKGPASISTTQVLQTVKINYIYNDRQIQKTIVDNQEWTYYVENKEWRRTNPIPKL